jgi:hypothetical protein
MQRLLLGLLLLLILMPALPAAARESANDAEVRQEVLRGFEEILDLWRDGNYGALYDRTSGSETRETFASRLRNAPLKPACCWEKMQGATATVKGASSATVKATLGFDGPGNTGYKTKSFKLRKEGEFWQISRSELLALAEARKGRHRTPRIHR